MRLISFVAISFLAITVSAQPPQDHLYQSLQQSDQAEVEQARLTAAYEKEKAIFSPVNRRLKISMQEITDLKDKMNSIAVKFKETDLDDNDEWKLKKEHRDAKARLDVLITKYDEKFLDFIKLRTACDSAWAALNLLLENQDLIKKHDAEFGVNTRLSPDFFYHIGFLKEQIDTIPKRIEDSLKELEGIKSNEAPLSDNLKYQRDLLTVIVRRLRVQHEIAKDILQKHEQSQTMGGQIMQFFNSYLPNA
ncbi:hypothetical protein BASA83_008655 [Batrachochytrium salamandrivorans]|nr:hypothetical protein BASA81_012768 [Batrachochytrium salamandrivorans]KAH9269293.1 hypothetical protein BASA83_008655 [Batrachochytrium salamandrivorans]